MDDGLARHIGRRLRSRRRLLELTQKELGARCGVSFQMIHKYENGLVQLSAAGLYELSRALQVSSTYFFDGFCRELDRHARGAHPPA